MGLLQTERWGVWALYRYRGMNICIINFQELRAAGHACENTRNFPWVRVVPYYAFEVIR